MNVPVHIAGVSRSWRTLEGTQIASWVRNGPWFSEPMSCVVRVGAEQAGGLVHEVSVLVRGSEQWGGIARVDVLPTRNGSSLAEALAGWMDLTPTTLRVLCEALGRTCRGRPRLLVAHLPEGANVALWLDGARRLLDVYRKVVADPSVALLVVCDSSRQPAGVVRADLAWPSESAGSTVAARWSAYVHERVAWHLAGNLGRFRTLGGGLASLAVGDDPGLEDALDAHAVSEIGLLEAELGQALKSDLRPALNDPELCMPKGLLGPGVATVARPAPWLARGLLLLWPEHPRRRYLMSLRTCRPLADRLLGRCMDLEQDARDRLLGDPGPCPSEFAHKHIEALRNEARHPEHLLTPRGRSVMVDPWDAADFFSVVQLETRGSTRSRLHELRRVRNALAHGVEVGWRALEIVDRLAGDLARS